MSVFASRLSALNVATPTPASFVFVPYDQLTTAVGPLSRAGPAALGVVVVESPAKARLRPYHQQKLALLLTNLRHFALEVAASGRRVVHLVADGDYASALGPFAAAYGPLDCMVPAERELREDLGPLVEQGLVRLVPHEGWLGTDADFRAASPTGEAPWRMDAFYRAIRRRTGILMDERDKPVGGRFSFDGDNRKPWKGVPVAPVVPRFVVDDITAEVVALVSAHFGDHPGQMDPPAIPASIDDAEVLWAWAQSACLPSFGPFEDAMSTRSRGLFHTRISPLMNLHRLLPRRIVDDVVALDLPHASTEGFIRQILGWREFVHRVHVATDGFRNGPGCDPAGAPSLLGADLPVPPAFWPPSWGGAPSGLRCLDSVVQDVWAEGYSHHITRLMVLANIGALLDVSPRALTDWFWVAYVDAYDWVVEPNVLGMGTFAVGDIMTTKPYIAGAAYIDRMSDFCGPCAFSPKKPASDGGCPLTPMYWAYLQRHEPALKGNERLKLPLASSRKRSDVDRASSERVYQITRRALQGGERLQPASFAVDAPGTSTT